MQLQGTFALSRHSFPYSGLDTRLTGAEESNIVKDILKQHSRPITRIASSIHYQKNII
jgi:hypothetical protein